MNAENPYKSPQTPCRPDHDLTLPLLPHSLWPEIDVHVAQAQRGWWSRRLTLAGSMDAELYYNGAGNGERLYVNNGLVATTSPMHWQLVWPQIDFHLEYKAHLVPARIDVAASLWRLLSISVFRLTIAGRTIYQE